MCPIVPAEFVSHIIKHIIFLHYTLHSIWVEWRELQTVCAPLIADQRTVIYCLYRNCKTTRRKKKLVKNRKNYNNSIYLLIYTSILNWVCAIILHTCLYVSCMCVCVKSRKYGIKNQFVAMHHKPRWKRELWTYTIRAVCTFSLHFYFIFLCHAKCWNDMVTIIILWPHAILESFSAMYSK